MQRSTLAFVVVCLFPGMAFSQTVSPLPYSAYSGVDPKPAPPAPALGPANSIINDPTFGSRILRVTDQNTAGGQSFIPTDAGFHRTWNSNSTAIKLEGPQGQGYWLEFNPNTFSVGDGSSHPLPHQLPINYFWEWSAVDPDTIYFLNGSALARYNKATSTAVNLASTPTGEPVTSYAVVVGLDNWVCSAAGAGYQDTYTKILCVTPSNPSSSKFIDVAARTINGVTQSDPNWPTSASGQTIGIHSINGGAGASWLGVTFHQQSWGGNGDAVFNLATNTWSLVTNADPYWSGHTSIGNGKFVNGSGSIDGRDGRGAVVRDPNDLMNSAKYLFVMQPQPTFGWFDGEHSSWFNSTSNPNAPVLFSRYTTVAPSPWQTWEGEIIAAATDGSNKVWRFAHTHCPLAYNYYASAFAQISYDGRFALFSSYWDGTLGVSSTGNFIATRIDTFIVELAGQTTPLTVGVTSPAAGATVTGIVTVAANASDAVGVTGVQFFVDGAPVGAKLTVAPYALQWSSASAANGTHSLTAGAFNGAGLETLSAPVAITVSNPPLISSIAVGGITASAATITWTTNEPATSRVDDGTSTAYGSTVASSTLVVAHSLALSGLPAATTIHYKASSIDALGNVASSADATFTTAAQSGPLAYWKLADGSGVVASDATGDGYAGQLLNGPVWVASPRPALWLDGVAGYVDVAHAPPLDAFPITVSAWLNTTSTAGLQGIVNKYLPSSFNGYQIFMNQGTVCAWYFRDASDYVWDGTGCTLATAGLNDGQWHQVALTVDLSAGSLYVDGQLRASRAWTGAAGPATTSTDVNLGRYPGVNGGYFPGQLSNIRLYARALSPSEIASVFATEAGPIKQPVSWINVVNATVNGSSLTKTGGYAGVADAGGSSLQQITAGNGRLEFTASETNTLRFVGLGVTTINPAAIAFAIRFQAGVAEVRELGTYRSDTPFVSGDRFTVSVENGQVVYYKNGTAFYRSLVAPAYPLTADATLFDLGATVTNATMTH